MTWLWCSTERESVFQGRSPWAKRLRASWLPLAIALSSCSRGGENSRTESSMQLAHQRVNVTPRRDTLSLVHVTTTHGKIVTTPEHPFAKVGADASDAMEHIRQQRVELRRGWQTRIESRLSEARRQRQDVQRYPAFRDEELEAERSHHVALLEHELARGP